MRINPIIVQKYGGACLETPTKIRAVASSLADLHSRGHRVVAIVSAMGKTTDELVKTAYQVSSHPNRRELDMLLTAGERISMSLMSMALSDLGVPAISFTGSQAGVMTDESHSSARILDVRPVRVREELDRGRIVVLAGFQGVNPVTKEITTLGRGGSDTTAVAMAAVLKANCCEIIKEVDGVCSADPHIVANAKSIRQLDFASLSEMCFWGAKVLHFRSVELAQSQNVPLVLKKWGGGEEHSTQVMKGVAGMESGKVLAVNSMARVEHVEIDSSDLNQGFEKFARHLKENGLPWPQLLASAFTAGKTRIMMTCDAESLDTLLRTVERTKDLRKQRETLSSVSLTCFGGVSSDLPFKAIQILQHHGIIADKYVLSPHSVNLFVPVETREAAVKALHSLI
ncbi:MULTISPECIES: aspartate kinase [Bradyrhizobium]|jgi:aspartate kinase|uniref:Aspartokinase n=2 Tax=Bradyrhizobium TaxID=374 RepID=A0ABY0PYY7_9BRAD|nr:MULTISPECIES: aspartate kinase [Bradyrhizobium]SDJ18278.1 aspartate kinase [Bradyrhizobium ottawaense]SEC84305.1 aspartate kinase [Bradyrhizobium lablabi]SHK94042.1 aspartate kinase [Bradyrhizobium lablabi]